MNKISLSALIIAKDSENYISRALRSIREIAKQIVVVDTGSSDSTTRISSIAGAELHFFKWNNSFADARNYALQFAREEWILIIDTDEELDIDSFFNNIELFENENINALRCEIVNYLDGDISTTHKYPRIFRNRKEFAFEGNIHEQISDSIKKAGHEIIDTDIKIYHYGYKELKAEKLERNIELLEESQKKDSDDGFYKYHLGENHFTAQEFDKAYDNFISALATEDLSLHQRELAQIRLGQIYLSKDELDKAEEILNFHSNEVEREGFRKFILGAIETQKREFPTALHLFQSSECRESMLVSNEKLDFYITELTKIVG